MKKLLFLVVALFLVIPSLAEARGFSGGSHSSFHSSSSRSFSSTRSSSSRSFGSSTRSKTVSLSKSPTSKSTTSRSFSGGSSTKSSTYKSSTSRSFSGRTSTVTGRTYRSTPTRTYYNGHYVTVSHYYHASIWHPFSYYNGFTSGMFWGSMFHPWGHTYYMGGQYVDYGPSPLAWVFDIIGLLIFIGIIVVIYRALHPKKIYTRRF